ncbi:hypothetical protein BHM03_00012803 [Ensete ventricosum]|nr:hypothetical protein BHM03_00012803 [Ensete ventricosum]
MLTDVRLPAQVGQVLVIVRDGCRQASTGTASLPQKRPEVASFVDGLLIVKQASMAIADCLDLVHQLVNKPCSLGHIHMIQLKPEVEDDWSSFGVFYCRHHMIQLKPEVEDDWPSFGVFYCRHHMIQLKPEVEDDWLSSGGDDPSGVFYCRQATPLSRGLVPPARLYVLSKLLRWVGPIQR